MATAAGSTHPTGMHSCLIKDPMTVLDSPRLPGCH